jgi:NAD(P)-dependent dehydrogenase (short-subunit alcohol dehydrogenase family)
MRREKQQEGKNMAQLDGSIALVTGAASGIGRSTALHYARDGAKVVISDIAEDGGAETVRMVEEMGGEATFVRADVGNRDECRALVERTVSHFGRLDIACNNAGVSGASAPTGEYDVDDWDRVIRINLSSVFYCMRYQIPAMLENGGGVIVNVASILGAVGFASAPAYVAAKHGVVGLTKATAIEYAQQNIRVTSVGPAFISTPLIAALEEDEQANQMLVSQHPIGRLGRSEEVAALIVFLSSPAASFITGSYHAVDGAYLAR